MRASDKGKDKEPKVKKKPGRTPTSCAECRRLKLRCDKNVPCEKCVSRGCAEICPNGVMASIKGNRMVLSGTEELHERISQLQGRVRELESALRTVQADVSLEPHPLLGNDKLRIPPLRPSSQQGSSPASASSSSKSSATGSQSSPTSIAIPSNPAATKREQEDTAIDAFGTLTIGQNGAAIYLGKTARSEYLLRAPLKEELDPSSSSGRYHDYRTAEGQKDVAFLDFDSRDDPYVRDQVYKRLPSLSEAVRLCEVYLEHGKYMYTPVTRTELLDEIVMTIYQQSTSSYQSQHALALLFSILALASHFDPQEEPYSSTAGEYYYLARTSLGFASPVRQTTLAAIQTLIHVAQYLDLTDSESPSVWIYIGHALRFASSIGLHLDAARWSLPQHEIDRRSRVFWQLFSLDTWTSFYLGRPPSLSPSFIDCPYPAEPESVPGRDFAEITYHSWSYRFTTLLNTAMASGMGPKQPPYSTILHLDQQIRDFSTPPSWKATSDPEEVQPSVDIQMYRWFVLSNKETVLLNLHRAYFAQALHDSPHDIQRHRYLPSVVAIYRASWRLIRGLQIAWGDVPTALARSHLPWSQALSAAIVMCLLVTKMPSCHLTPPAIESLEALYLLFRTAAETARGAETLFPSIQRLFRKAREATSPIPRHDSAYSEPPITHTELDRLSGKTHLFAESQGYSSPAHSSSSRSSKENAKGILNPSRSTSVTLSDDHHGVHPPTSTATAPTATSTLPQDAELQMHPILLDDLKDFAAFKTVPSNMSLSDGTRDSETSTPTCAPMTGIIPTIVSEATPPSFRVPSQVELRGSSGSRRSGPSPAPSSSGRSSGSMSGHGRGQGSGSGSGSGESRSGASPFFQDTLSHGSARSRHEHPRSNPGSHYSPSTSHPQEHRLPPPPPPLQTSYHSSESYHYHQHYYSHQDSSPTAPSRSSYHYPHHSHGRSYSHSQPYSSHHSPNSSSPTTSSLSVPPGFTTDYREYVSTGHGTGFVSGFESAGTALMLDGTWQGFVEQLGF